MWADRSGRARRRSFPDLRGRCWHGGHGFAHLVPGFFRDWIGLRDHRHIVTRTRVEYDLLRKSPRRGDPDNGPVRIGRARALYRGRKIPVRSESSASKNPPTKTK